MSSDPSRTPAATTTVATFGVALSSAYLAPEAHASVIDLSSNLPGDLDH